MCPESWYDADACEANGDGVHHCIEQGPHEDHMCICGDLIARRT